jgi:hypothetical protein
MTHGGSFAFRIGSKFRRGESMKVVRVSHGLGICLEDKVLPLRDPKNNLTFKPQHLVGLMA